MYNVISQNRKTVMYYQRWKLKVFNRHDGSFPLSQASEHSVPRLISAFRKHTVDAHPRHQ